MKSRILTSLLSIIFLVTVVGGLYFQKTSSFPANPPMKEETSKFFVHYSFSSTAPFLFKYYLYEPINYDPKYAYPLVLMLHGASRHMYGGIYASKKSIQKTHPMFVVVPIAPRGLTWAAPEKTGGQAYKFARKSISDVQKRYQIDSNRIYVTGYSMGGAGTFGMLAHYPDLFAAAAPLCGYWSGNIQDYFTMPDIPVQIHHGTQDASVPYEASETAALALQTLNRDDVDLITHQQRGHNVWDPVYREEYFWSWLNSHSKN